MECYVVLLSPTALVVRELTVIPSAESDEQVDTIPAALTLSGLFETDNWLPFLRPGRHGRMDKDGMTAPRLGLPGNMVIGPHWSLPAGSYEMIARIQPGVHAWSRENVVSAEICAGDTLLAAADAPIASLPFDRSRRTSLFRLPFEIDDLSLEKKPVQLRVLSSWLGGYKIWSLSLRQRDIAPGPRDLCRFFLNGYAGQRAGGHLQNGEYRVGCIAYSPTVGLRAGAYRVSYGINIRKGLSRIPEGVPVVVIVAKEDSKIIAAGRVKPGLASNEHRDLIFNLAEAPNRLYRLQFSVWAIAPVKASIERFLLDRTDAEPLPSDGAFDDLPAFVRKTRRSSTDRLKSLRDRANQSRFINRLYKRLYRV